MPRARASLRPTVGPFSEEETRAIRKIAASEATALVNSRRAQLLEDVGAFVLEGKLDLDAFAARVDTGNGYVDILQFLRMNLASGQKIKITVMQGG